MCTNGLTRCSFVVSLCRPSIASLVRIINAQGGGFQWNGLTTQKVFQCRKPNPLPNGQAHRRYLGRSLLKKALTLSRRSFPFHASRLNFEMYQRILCPHAPFLCKWMLPFYIQTPSKVVVDLGTRMFLIEEALKAGPSKRK